MAGYMNGGFGGILEVRAMPGFRIGQQLQGRQLAIQCVPVLDRENDVVVTADLQNWHGGQC